LSGIEPTLGIKTTGTDVVFSRKPPFVFFMQKTLEKKNSAKHTTEVFMEKED
jgi:hypothetical protein